MSFRDTAKYMDDSRRRLNNIITKKVQTTMIGAISQFEEGFGFLWGHGEETITPDQEQMRAVWDEVRTNILNNGNNQIRALNQELQQYDIKWNRYSVTLPFKPRREVHHEE